MVNLQMFYIEMKKNIYRKLNKTYLYLYNSNLINIKIYI